MGVIAFLSLLMLPLAPFAIVFGPLFDLIFQLISRM